MSENKKVIISNWPAAIAYILSNFLQIAFAIILILLTGHCGGCLVLPGIGPSKIYIRDTQQYQQNETAIQGLQK